VTEDDLVKETLPLALEYNNPQKFNI